MLPGLRTPEGAVYILDSLPDAAGAGFNGGVLVEPTGEVHVSSILAPQQFVNGFGVRSDGKLCIAYGGHHCELPARVALYFGWAAGRTVGPDPRSDRSICWWHPRGAAGRGVCDKHRPHAPF